MEINKNIMQWCFLKIEIRNCDPNCISHFHPLHSDIYFLFPGIWGQPGPLPYFSPFYYVVWKQIKRMQVWPKPIILCLSQLKLKACSQKCWTTPPYSRPSQTAWQGWGVVKRFNTLPFCFQTLFSTVTLHNDNSRIVSLKGRKCMGFLAPHHPQCVCRRLAPSLT